jgi:ABC-type antimicrobial peptide transport system permease subunit
VVWTLFVDVLVWWRDVGQARCPRIPVMTRQFLDIPTASVTTERVFGFTGLTLSVLLKSRIIRITPCVFDEIHMGALFGSCFIVVEFLSPPKRYKKSRFK